AGRGATPPDIVPLADSSDRALLIVDAPGGGLVKLARMSIGRLTLAVAFALVILAPGAGPVTSVAAAPAQQATVTVFAASSLTDAFKEIGDAFQQDKGVAVTFNFAASSALRTQMTQGASADVFASADQANMDSARQAGVINGADVTFAKNRLV